MAISIGHSNSAYSFEVVYPNGSVIAAANLDKLQDRAKKNTLKGSGDDR